MLGVGFGIAVAFGVRVPTQHRSSGKRAPSTLGSPQASRTVFDGRSSDVGLRLGHQTVSNMVPLLQANLSQPTWIR